MLYQTFDKIKAEGSKISSSLTVDSSQNSANLILNVGSIIEMSVGL